MILRKMIFQGTYEHFLIKIFIAALCGLFSDGKFILVKILHGKNQQVRKIHILCHSLFYVLMALLEISQLSRKSARVYLDLPTILSRMKQR